MLGLGGSAQLGIGLSIILDDRFSAAARRVSQNMRMMSTLNDHLARQAVKDYSDKSLSMAMGTAAVSLGLLQAAKSGAEYEHQLRKVAIVANGELGKRQLDEIAGRLSSTFNATPLEAMGALFENVKAGVTKNIELVTQYQVAVAKATDETLEGEEGVAKGLLSIANSMQIPYSKIADVANAVTVAANQTQASVESLNNAMKYTANTASVAGYSMQEILASLGQLSQMGIEGTAAGTAMSNFIRYSTRAGGLFATKKQVSALALAGLAPKDLRDAQGNLIKIGDMIDLLGPRIKGLPTGVKQDILEGIFGVRGEKAAVNLLGEDGRGGTYKSLLAQIHAGMKKDIAMKQAKAMMDDLQGDLLQVKVQWSKLLIEFTKAVEPTLRKIIPMFTKGLSLLGKFLGTFTGKAIATIAVIVTPLAMALFAFRGALLAATLALGSSSASMGFGTALSAALGSAGGRGLYGRGLANVGINAAGSLYARAGGAFAHGAPVAAGRIITPAWNMANTWGSSIGTTAVGSAIGTRAVGLLGGISTVGSSILRFITGPWGIAIGAAMLVIPSIYGLIKKRDEDPTLRGYAPGFSGYQLIPGYDQSRVAFLNKMGQSATASKELHNNINVYLNGSLVGQSNAVNSIDDEQEIFNQINHSF